MTSRQALLSNATWRRVFRPRGIGKELAEARPYVSYVQGDGHEVLTAQAGLEVPEEARWSAQQLRAAAKDSGGLAMMRHPAPLLGDDFFTEFYSRPIMAELRPDDGVADRPIHHRHCDGRVMRPFRKPKDAWQRENESVWWRDLGDLSDVDRTAVFYAENERAQNEALWDLARRGDVTPNSPFEAWLEDHPPPKVVPKEVRALRAEGSTLTHLVTSHADGEGLVRCTNHLPGCHMHYGTHKYHFPKGAGNGARLDMHPWAAERLQQLLRSPTDWYVVFALEGCLKADAALEHILDHNEPATVVSVPSITLWHQADGLQRFTMEYLQGLSVYVVCDSDWDPTDERRSKTMDPNAVVRQARTLTAQLRAWGAQAVAVGPTPEPRACRLHNAKRHDKRGLDDYLADHGTFEELFHSDVCIIPAQNERRRPVPLSDEALDGMDMKQRRVHLEGYYRRRAAEAGGTFFIRYREVANELFNDRWSHDTIRRDTLAMRDRGLLSVVPDTNHRGYTGVFITVR